MTPRGALLALLLVPSAGRRSQRAHLEASEGARFPISPALLPLLATVPQGPERPGAMAPKALAPRAAPLSMSSTLTLERDEDDEESPSPSPESIGASPSPKTKEKRASKQEDLPPLTADMSPLLTSAEITGPWGHGDIVLPASWAPKLVLKDFNVESATGSRYYTARTTLQCQPLLEVAIMAGRTSAPETVRDVRMTASLSNSGCVPTYFEGAQLDEATFMMTESPGSLSLGLHIFRRRAVTSGVSYGTPMVPLDECLPFIIDVLQGLVQMEKLQIVHGDLTEDKIFLVGSDRRAVITDFRKACKADSDDPLLACRPGGRIPGSVFRHAPESGLGLAPQVSSNMWQAGLILARMLFEYVPTQYEASKWMSQEKVERLSKKKKGKETIREAIREKFKIDDHEFFKALGPKYDDVKALLKGMLEIDPARRLTPTQALEAAEKAAAERDLTVLSAREPKVLPSNWQDEE